jgi:hypothetical protein
MVSPYPFDSFQMEVFSPSRSAISTINLKNGFVAFNLAASDVDIE